MRDIDALLKAGNLAQREKLEQNGHKQGFDNIDIDDAFECLAGEFAELDVEMMKDGHWKEKRHEAADIANYAHMIILACDRELEK